MNIGFNKSQMNWTLFETSVFIKHIGVAGSTFECNAYSILFYYANLLPSLMNNDYTSERNRLWDYGKLIFKPCWKEFAVYPLFMIKNDMSASATYLYFMAMLDCISFLRIRQLISQDPIPRILKSKDFLAPTFNYRDRT